MTMGAPGIEMGEGLIHLRQLRANFSALLQGFLRALEDEEDPLSDTRFHSSVGRIWDIVLESEELRRLVARALRELASE